MTQPRLSRIPLWQRHAETVLEIVRDALLLLSAHHIVGSETDFNRELYNCILRANRARYERGLRVLDVPINYEARNPPSPETKGMSSENKIPDFHCGYIDHQEPDPLRSARYFAIECKRLGRPTRSGWAFNKNYINNGVKRFVSPDWRYGKDVADGAMVGYMESMTPDELVVQVNSVAASLNIPPLERSSGYEKPLHELMHILNRDFPVTPFTLWHVWIEMLAAQPE